ncbi:hypothetical protein ACWF82_17040 [Nocardia sp. NPDC055053]
MPERTRLVYWRAATVAVPAGAVIGVALFALSAAIIDGNLGIATGLLASTLVVGFAGLMLRMYRRKYARSSESFGPESFVTSAVGLACISLPYTVSAARAAWWLIVLPLVLGGTFVILGETVTDKWSTSFTRAGVGLLVAFAGFALSLIGLLLTIAIASVFRH